MSMLTEDSVVVYPSDLELFKTSPTDITIQEMEEVPYKPTQTFSEESGDLHFDIIGNGEEYIKAALTYMTFELKIELSNGQPITAAHRVGVVDNFAHSVFQTVTTKAGNQVIGSDPCYPFRAKNTNQLSYGEDAKKSHLSTSIFVKDTANQMDTMYLPHTEANAAVVDGVNQAGNRGLNKRSRYFQESASVPCRIHPDTDFFNIPKMLINLVDISIHFTRSRPEFCIMAQEIAGVGGQPGVAPDFRIRIMNPILWITKVRLLPSVVIGHARALAAKPARYNMTRVVTRPFSITQGSFSATLDNVITGQLPKRLVMGFVKNSAYNGNYGQNPFNYEHLNLSQTAVYVNGKSHPLTPFRPVYTGNRTNWLREYSSLFDAMGIHHGNSGIDIHRDDYPNGYCLYGFDLSPNKSASLSSPVNLVKRGNLRIEMQFSEELPQAMMCMLFAEYDNVMTIDGDRNVYVDY